MCWRMCCISLSVCRLTELQYGMLGIDVHLYFLTGAEKVKVHSHKCRESDRSLSSHPLPN
jgi:hypothetical protein